MGESRTQQIKTWEKKDHPELGAKTAWTGYRAELYPISDGDVGLLVELVKSPDNKTFVFFDMAEMRWLAKVIAEALAPDTDKPT